MKEPERCDTVFATAVAQEGRIAICYWAHSKSFGVPLIMFDWSCEQLTSAVWSDAIVVLADAAERMRARYGSSGAWIEGEGLAQQAAGHGLEARAVPAWIEAKEYWPRLGVCAMANIRLGHYNDAERSPMSRVRLTDAAMAKTKRQAFGGLSYRGDERGDDPTVPAFLYGITMALDETATKDPKAETLHALGQSVAAMTASKVASLL